MADPPYERVQTSRAFEEVIAQVRRHTLEGQLKPGDRLPSERDLALKLGVSRNTIREALRGLETVGVLKLQKGAYGGAFLIAPNGNAVATGLQDMFQLGSVTPAQLTEARLHLTGVVVRVACERITEEDLLVLERSVEQAKAAGRDGDYVRRSRINLQFHRLLARATGNPVFVAIMDGLISIMEHFVDTLGPPRGTAVFASRARFIAHLRARDPVAATAEMEKYLKAVHKDYLSRRETAPGVPRVIGTDTAADPAPRRRNAARNPSRQP